MRVLWKSDLGQGKHDPLEIVAVETKTGSRISADLVVPLDPQAGPVSLAPDNLVAENAGLLEVIDAQLAAIDELAKAPANIPGTLVSDADYAAVSKELALMREWGATVQDLVGDLSVALGFARDPKMRTGIAELDALLEAVR